MSETDQLRWGILGTGWIADKFVRDLAFVDGTTATAVGSRGLERAEAFRQKHAIARAHGSYRDLVEDDDVDIIYVSSPHPFHAEHSLMALHAGKHVLCEKPFAMNVAQAQEVISAARSRGRFCMEGLWTRHFPATLALAEALGRGDIGNVCSVQADFSIAPPFDPAGRLWNKSLGGGALLDLGIYPVSFAHFVFGRAPTEVLATATFGTTGIDEQSSYILSFPGGGLATLSSSLRGWSPHAATIVGDKGYIHVPDFFHPRGFEVIKPSSADRRHESPSIGGTGLQYQVEEILRCLAEGRLESPSMPLHESLAILTTLDKIRERIDLRYP